MISAATSSVFCLLFQYYIPENGVGVNCNEKSLGCVGGRGGWGGECVEASEKRWERSFVQLHRAEAVRLKVNKKNIYSTKCSSKPHKQWHTWLKKKKKEKKFFFFPCSPPKLP